MSPPPPRLAGHPATWDSKALLAAVEAQRFKSSGPGGQHRNKVETGVRLVHRGSGIVGQASERRSVERNHAMALWRLRVSLALGQRCGLEAWPALPSERWVRRTSGPELSVGREHDDVPALLAEALDVLASVDDELPAAAERLGVSTTRLVKVLKLVPESLRELNRRLAAADRPTWR